MRRLVCLLPLLLLAGCPADEAPGPTTATEGGVAAVSTVSDWSAPVAGLRMRVTAKSGVQVENVGTDALVLLPKSFQRVYRPSAAFIPAPGPFIPPWMGAFSLAPGERLDVRSLGGGSWELRPDTTYFFSARLELSAPPKRVWKGGPNPPGRFWLGTLASPEVQRAR